MKNELAPAVTPAAAEAGIRAQFQQYFGKAALLAVAPGRVNLIGEHTDYNLGFVLPAAIDRNMYVGLAPNDRGEIRIYASRFAEELSYPLSGWQPVSGWSTYLLGMLHQLIPNRSLSAGLDILVDGNVPTGAGMSSSAALCSAFGLALNHFFGLGLSRLQLALAAQQTEHEFAGVQCGIMDMFASLHGKAGHLIKLDCRNLAYQYIPFHFPGLRIVLVNTMVSHALVDSEYNERRRQCEAGVAAMQAYDPAIRSLRDVPLALLKAHEAELNPLVYRRCRFILEENQRLLAGCAALEAGDPDQFGREMYAAHTGLSEDFGISCAESDFLVAEAKHFSAVKGARQMGGGFGGCVIHLIDASAVGDFIPAIRARYFARFAIDPDCYVMHIEEGARVLEG